VTRSTRFTARSFGVAGFLLAALLVFAYFLALSGSHILLPRGASYRMKALVPSAVALAAHADVRRAGVRIGEVDAVDTSGTHAVISLSIDEKYAPVYRDAQALVRAKSLVGENYVDLDPGTPTAGALPAGSTLSLDQAPEPTQFDQFLSTLDARHRRDVQRILDALGPTLRDHGGDLNTFLDGTAAVMRNAHTVNGILVQKRQQVASLIDDFGTVTRALGDRANDVRTMVRQSRVIAQAVAARDGKFRDTLAALPGFIGQAGRTIARLGRFSGVAVPVIRNLRLATDRLVPAMRHLRPAAVVARSTMHALDGFTRQATPMLGQLKPFSAAAARFMNPFEVTLRQINPFVAYLAPYAQEMGTVFSQMRAATENYDALGHYARIEGLVTKSSAVATFTTEQEQAYKALLRAGGISELTDTRGNNAYPQPGQAAKPTPGSGQYIRVTEDPSYSRPGR
jgi:phospholipid/cholesterol/gamma-HCH transport system substrate-binding protein